MKTINFTPKAFEEFNYWRSTDRKVQDKIIELIEDMLRNPFQGIGKPETFKTSFKRFLVKKNYTRTPDCI